MNGEKIIDLANYLIGDGEEPFDNTSVNDLILLNQIKEQIEGEEEWEFLKTQDRSNNTTLGYDWNDGYTLPANFLMPTAKGALYVDVVPYEQLPLSQNVLYKNVGLRFCIDYTQDKFFIMEEITVAKVITLNYIKKTDDITKTTEPTWPKYHERIAYKMAINWLKRDADEINVAKANALESDEDKIRKAMVNMNSKMSLTSGNMSMGDTVDQIHSTDRVDVWGGGN